MGDLSKLLPVGELSKLVAAESRGGGSVSWRVYWRYFMYMGPLVTLMLAVALVGGQAAYMGGDYWLGLWASVADQQHFRWISVYAGLVLAVIVAAAMRSGLFFIYSLRWVDGRLRDCNSFCACFPPGLTAHTTSLMPLPPPGLPPRSTT